MKDIAWVAVNAAACVFLGLLAACFGAGAENWYFLGLGGVFELAGLVLAVLALREDR